MFERSSEKNMSFREGGKMGIPAVYSDESMVLPKSLAYEEGTGFRCVCPQGNNGLLTCDRRARSMSASV